MQIVLNIVGALGFTLAAISLGWNIYTWCNTHRERLTCNVLCEISTRFREPSLVLQCANTGHLPIFLKSAEIVIGKAGRGKNELAVFLNPLRKMDETLPPGQQAEFALPQSIIARMSGPLRTKSVYIRVRSGRGTVATIKGKEVLPQLNAIRAVQRNSP